MRAKRLRYIVVLAVLAAAAAMLVGAPITSARSGAGGQSPLTAKEARALSTHITDRVIVVFKNQLSSLPDTSALRADRAAAVDQVQDPVVSELNLTHATHIKRFQLVNAVAAYVSAGEAKRLAANPAVAEVVPDVKIPLIPSPLATLPHGRRPGGGGGTFAERARSRPGAAGPTGHREHPRRQPPGDGPSAQGLGYTGAGVKVASIADGLEINNPNFIRADGQHVFIDYQDFSGSGTNAPHDGGEAFLDASSIAAQGLHTYNFADFGGTVTALRDSHPRRCSRREPHRIERVRHVELRVQLGVPGGDQLRRQRRPRNVINESFGATISRTRAVSILPHGQ